MALRVQRLSRIARAPSNWCLEGPLGAMTWTSESRRARSSSADHCVGMFGEICGKSVVLVVGVGGYFLLLLSRLKFLSLSLSLGLVLFLLLLMLC